MPLFSSVSRGINARVMVFIDGGDADFIPLVTSVKGTGAKVCLAHFPVNHSEEYLRTFDRRLSIHQTTFELNKLLDEKLIKKIKIYFCSLK